MHKIDFEDGGNGAPSLISNRNGFGILIICKLSWYVLPSLESICLLVQEKQHKIRFQKGSQGGHIGFTIGIILAIFDPRHHDASYKVWVSWLSWSGEEAKNRF